MLLTLSITIISILLATQRDLLVPLQQPTTSDELVDQPLNIIEPLLTKDTVFYKEQWKVVDSLNNKGLYESAIKKAEEIKKIAIAEKNAAQAYKALNYIFPKLKVDNSDEIFNYIENESKHQFEPYQQLVYWVKANLFQQLFRNRIFTLPKNYEGVEQWTEQKLVEKYLEYSAKSLSNAALLQQTLIDNHYEAVLVHRVPENRKYRMTLYDLLVQAFLESLNNGSFNLPKMAEAFDINQTQFFKPAQDFLTQTIATPDTLDNQYQTIKWIQLLMNANKNAGRIDAFVDNDLQRLSYLYNNSVLEEKSVLYENALKSLFEQYKEEEVSTRIQFDLAKLYYDWANLYSYMDSSTFKYKNKAVEALFLCENAVQRFPKSFGAKQCQVLMQTIKHKELNFMVLESQTPQQAILFQANYLNVDKIYLRYQKVKFDMKYIEEEETFQFDKNTTVKEIALANPNDYLRHTTEFHLPSLEVGYYQVQISTSPNFELPKGEEIQNKDQVRTASLSFWVTNLNYQYNALLNEVYVFDKKTGTPIQNASVKLYKSKYKSGNYVRVLDGTFTTDKNGIAKISSIDNYENYVIGLKNKEDEYVNRESSYFYKERNYELKVNHQYSIFLDRAIYRPGQMVYFKGLINTNEGLYAKVVAKEEVSFEMKDANYKSVFQQKFKSNDFGTFEGSFSLPSNGLNGVFTITINGKYVQSFRVEDYKRPQFEVKLEQPKQQFKVNDSVRVKGTAMALGGFAVSNAKAKFSVVRKTNYPWYVLRYMPFSQDEQKITDGTIDVNEKGEFEFLFKALPNLKSNPKNDPIFNYFVQVDVTDLSGETRTAQIQIPIGYKSLQLSNNLSDEIDLAQTPKKVNILAKNLSGEDVPTSVKITVSKLKHPQKTFVARPFNPAEFTTISATDFNQLFPQYAYKYENLIKNFPLDQQVYSTTIQASKDSISSASFFKNIVEGYYKVEMEGNDAFGQKVKTTQYISVINTAAKKPIVPITVKTKTLKNTGKIGEKAALFIATSEKDLLLTVEEITSGKLTKRQQIKLSNQHYIYEVPFTQEMEKGNIYYNFYINYKDQSYVAELNPRTINTTQQLDLKLITERTILEPNVKETWKLVIQNDEKKPVTDAELLVSMYDASLDFFVKHQWNFYPQNNQYFSNVQRNSLYKNVNYGNEMYYLNLPSYDAIVYEKLKENWFRLYIYAYGNNIKYDETRMAMTLDRGEQSSAPKNSSKKKENQEREGKFDDAPAPPAAEGVSEETLSPEPTEEAPATRTNFKETAFFFPAIFANEKGEYSFNFTMPEAITRWNFNAFALTKDLKYGFTSSSVMTQKQLMVNTFSPVFLREKDTLYFSAKITNLTDQTVAATTQIQFVDAITGKAITAEIVKEAATKEVSIKKGESISVKWKTVIPSTSDALTYKITAKTEKHQDGEEKTIPVLKNRMLVTETLPLWVRAKQNKSFVFANLDKLNQSKTIQNQSFTLEFTSNPAWYAVQSLPYLMEYPYECSEQTFSRVYANALAKHVVDQNPKIKSVFQIWKDLQPEALASNLEKNQELKNILLEETPWLRQANNESERKRRIALLFDLNKMNNAYESDLRKLKDNQLNSGAWPWFKGGREDRYITQYIVTGIGKLTKLGIKNDDVLFKMAHRAIQYLDEQLNNDYVNLLKQKTDLEKVKPDYFTINYFYMRSFFKDVMVKDANKKAYDFYFGQLKKYWLHDNIYMQAQLAIIHHRYENGKIAQDIMKSIEELSFQNEEMGKYWKANRGYFWYEAPIETQALLIETYNEVSPNNQKAIEEMKLWLLKNKQTNDWKTTKATAEAIYALLFRGNNLLETEQFPVIHLGNNKIDPNTDASIKTEAGTGYFKVTLPKDEITTSLKSIKIENPNNVPAWGAVYWQYFEDLDKITPSETGVSIVKKLYVERNGARGKELELITPKTVLKVGDRVKMRMEIRSDRNLEYVHIKDMRASAFHPENVLSGYRWQNGIGYYESTRDAATNFFVSLLRKGTYIFEYPMRITHEGNFSNGITTVQCMYAPEFSSHSEGIRVQIK